MVQCFSGKSSAKLLVKQSALAFLLCVAVWPQAAVTTPPAPTVAEVKDPLGRSTPRGTVLGFLMAAGKGDNEVAAQYLNTHETPKNAAALANELYVVLNKRLPAQLNEISDRPQGTATSLLKPDLYLVGNINGTNLDITLERVEQKEAGPIWLFSHATLESIPEVFSQTDQLSVEDIFPPALVNHHFLGIVAYEWLFFLVGLPLTYALTVVLDRVLLPPVQWILGRLRPGAAKTRQVLPQPIRLLIVVAAIRWMVSEVGLPLIPRQFWLTAATTITICACVWLFMLINARIEQHVRVRLQSRSSSGGVSVQRLLHRSIDLLFVVAGALTMLRHFGINPTAALAGLGVGGVAVALAAQKTLENVVGGISLIMDEAVRVGDVLKVGEVAGSVEDIGLRSIRIRTLERTIVVIPNGQLANMNLEILSSRDKFWFHPVIALRYETTSPEISSVTEALRTLLISDSHVDSESVRVRFFQLSSFSLNIEVFAYVFAQDWIHFLEVQEQLLHGVITALQQFRVHFSFLPSAYIPADIDKGYSAPLLLREAKVRSAGAASQ